MNLFLISDNIFMVGLISKLKEIGCYDNTHIVCVARTNQTEYKFLSDSIPYVAPKSFENSIYFKNIANYNKVILIPFGAWQAEWIGKIPQGPEVYWIALSGSLRNATRTVHQTIAPKTAFFFTELGLLAKPKTNVANVFLKAINRVDFFKPFHTSEIALLRSLIPNRKYKQFSFDFHLPGLFTEEIDVNSRIIEGCRTIVIGNSSAISNNYIDAIDILSSYEFPEDVRFMPLLGYGDSRHAVPVIEYGQKKLGDKFIAHTTLMEEAEHNKFLQGAYAAIMPHFNRCQGGLTIKKLLYYGKKVFFFPSNPMYLEYSKKCSALGNLDQLNPENMLTPLSKTEKEEQQNFIRYKFDPERIDKMYKRLFGQ